MTGIEWLARYQSDHEGSTRRWAYAGRHSACNPCTSPASWLYDWPVARHDSARDFESLPPCPCAKFLQADAGPLLAKSGSRANSMPGKH